MDSDVAVRLARVRARVAAAALSVGRDPAEVDVLLAVKTQPAGVVRTAIEAGARLLGHNRAQELVATAPLLVDLTAAHGVETHFIGHLQSNKVGHVLPWVTCVQTVDSPALAARLDRVAARSERVLEVFVQVNTSAEATKNGVPPQEALALTYAVGAAEHLRLRGLMTIGANSPDAAVVRDSFEHLAMLRSAVLTSGAPGTAGARELSMGMSGDLEHAVAAGSTMVRVGSAVFGPRPQR